MPAVSIVLPTYNRAEFLPQAFASIRSQTFTDWELIVVDDGSTDDTSAVVAELTRGWEQPVRYHRQENQGAYGARNTGLDLVRGEFVAFFDSDDVWLPHHLADCAGALAVNPDVDWVYGASRIVDQATGRELSPSSFYQDGRPREFLTLAVEARGRLRVIRDGRVLECQLRGGLYCGLQVSVLRRRVFDDYRFEAVRGNEAEDQLLVVEALAAGRRLAYFDAVHLIYVVHAGNSSAAGAVSPEKHLRLFRALVSGYEQLRGRVRLTPAQVRELERKLSRDYFWNLGYALVRQPGRADEGLALMRRGMRLWPTNVAYWKTYGLAKLRCWAGNL